MSGIFISFEGIDGAGKSTHISTLAELLRQQTAVKVTQTREPGGTELAEQIRQLILKQKMDALTEALLVFAARRDHLMTLIKPALQRGEVVLCDRFTDATFAYQGAGRGFDMKLLQTLEQWVQFDNSTQQLCQPDLTFWFDVPVSLSQQRLQLTGNLDRFEEESTQFFERVSAGYAARAEQEPERFVRIDAQQSIEQVFAQLKDSLRQRNILLSQ